MIGSFRPDDQEHGTPERRISLKNLVRLGMQVRHSAGWFPASDRGLKNRADFLDSKKTTALMG